MSVAVATREVMGNRAFATTDALFKFRTVGCLGVSIQMHAVAIAMVMAAITVPIVPIGCSITSEYARYCLKVRVGTLKQKSHSLLCRFRCALNRICLFFFACALTIDLLFFLFRSSLLESNVSLQLDWSSVTKRIFSFWHLRPFS